jgi:hypothetical protein
VTDIHDKLGLQPLQPSTNYFKICCCKEAKDSKGKLSFLKLFVCAFFLVFAATTEKVSFKISVDNMFPFNLIQVQIIFILSFFIHSFITIYLWLFTKEISIQFQPLPHCKIFSVAIFDTLNFVLLISTASFVSPTMTVIFLYSNNTFICLLSTIVGLKKGNYSPTQLTGVNLILIAIFVGFFKSIILATVQSNGAKLVCNIIAVIFYIVASGLQGFISLYKENIVINLNQPINIYKLNVWLFFYQTVSIFLISIVYWFLEGNFFYYYFCTNK